MGVVDEIKERLDIVEVVSSYVPLQKAGRNFKAPCPFHSEKTPSFFVFPESQRYHCFGACGEGGDIFTFAMKQEGWDFRTALEELARRAGVELQPRTPAQVQREEETDRLRNALAAASAYYHNLLLHAPEAEEARAYVERRGLTQETMVSFQLGYSLDKWDGLRNYLFEKGFGVDEMERAGLLVEREDGTSYDRFRGRLMIPIRDGRGQVVGFGARTLDPEGLPKYINSPQTVIFDKSGTLFGLDMARRAIREQDQAVVVEGYMGVLRSHQEGFTNVVAQMGTALTEPQVRRLQRSTANLVLALDPDDAGVQATLRGLEVARETLDREQKPVFNPRGLVGFERRLGAEIRILSLPAGYDPDDLIAADPQQWADLVTGAVPVVEFVFERLLADADRDDAKHRARIVDHMLPLLRDVSDPVERETYTQKIARALGVREQTLLDRLHRAERKSARAQPKPPPEAAVTGGPADLEWYFLEGLIRHPWLLAEVNQTLVEFSLPPMQLQDFYDPANRALFEAWRGMVRDGTPSPEGLQEAMPEPIAERLEGVAELEDTLADEQWVRESVRAGLRIRKRALKEKGAELQILAKEVGFSEMGGSMTENTRALLQVEQALARRRSLKAAAAGEGG